MPQHNAVNRHKPLGAMMEIKIKATDVLEVLKKIKVCAPAKCIAFKIGGTTSRAVATAARGLVGAGLISIRYRRGIAQYRYERSTPKKIELIKQREINMSEFYEHKRSELIAAHIADLMRLECSIERPENIREAICESSIADIEALRTIIANRHGFESEAVFFETLGRRLFCRITGYMEGCAEYMAERTVPSVHDLQEDDKADAAAAREAI